MSAFSVNPWAHGSLDNMNRTRIQVAWWDQNALGVTLDHGNGNSDPVWSIGVEVHLPLRLADLLAAVTDRFSRREHVPQPATTTGPRTIDHRP